MTPSIIFSQLAQGDFVPTAVVTAGRGWTFPRPQPEQIKARSNMAQRGETGNGQGRRCNMVSISVVKWFGNRRFRPKVVAGQTLGAARQRTSR